MAYALSTDKRFARQKPLRGSRLNFGHPLAKGLLGAWVLNELSGNLCVDLVAGNNGTFTGNIIREVDYVRAPINVANSNTGTDYVSIPNRSAYTATNSHLSVAVSAVNTYSGNTALMGDDFDGSTISWNLQPESGKGFGHYNGGFGWSGCSGTGLDGNRHTFGGVADGTKLYTYLDGIVDGQANGTLPSAANTTTFRLGAAYAAGGSGWHGRIYFAYVWNRPLTAAEMRWIHSEPYSLISPPHARRVFSIASAAPKTPLSRYLSRRYAFFDRGERIST